MEYKKFLVLILCLFVPLALAIPEDLNINGKLTNSDGNPLSGTFSMNFSIYNVASGGSSLWSVAGKGGKIYKLQKTYSYDIFPGDSKESPDDFLLGGSYG